MSYCLFISSVNIFLCFDKWFDIFLSDWYIHSNPSLSWLCTGMNILNGSHSVTKQNPPGHFYALVNPSLNFDKTIPNFWSNRPLWLYLRIFELKKKNGWKSLHLIWYLQVIIKLLSHQYCVLKATLLRPWKTQNA